MPTTARRPAKGKDPDVYRFTMLRVYTDCYPGERVVHERGLSFAQCLSTRKYPTGPQWDKAKNRPFVYTHVLTDCLGGSLK